MKIRHFLLAVLTLIGINACKNTTSNNDSKTYLPHNLNEAVAYLNKDWNIIQKTKFKNSPEQQAVISLHFSTGMWIRNNWIHGDRDTDLVKYFNKIGVFAADDMSSIILTCFHRKLNNKDFDISGQVKKYQAYWKPIIDCEIMARKIAIENYNKYNVGSTIIILMPVDTSDKQRNATTLVCPISYWKFNSTQDLKISGVVTEKHFINDSSNVFFKVKINKMNFPNTEILMHKVRIGDTQSFSLINLTIK